MMLDHFWQALAIYKEGILASFVAFEVVMVINVAIYIKNSIRFLYAYYIEHGEFCFWAAMPPEEEAREQVANSLGLTQWNVNLYAWGCCLMWSTIFLVATALSAFVWPLVIFIGVPWLLVRHFGAKARKRKLFLDGLKGRQP